MKNLYLLLAAGMLTALSASAVEVGATVDLTENLRGRVLSVDGNNHKVEVMANPDAAPSGILDIKNTYFIGDDNFTVTRIAEKGFSHTDLTYVSVGVDLTSIGTEAFNGCTHLKAFKESTRGGVVSVGDYAFAYTYAMNEISLPGVATVGEFSFMRSNVQKVDLPALENISAGAFQECSKLDEINVGDNLRTIGNIAFTNCKALRGFTFGPNLQSIGTTAFGFCEVLEQVVVPSSLISMGRDAFQGCGIKRVYILADNFMDYCDAGKVLRHKSITEIYCLGSLVGEVSAYLVAGSEDNPADTLAEASVEPMEKVLGLQQDESAGERMFKAEEYLEGISDLHLYDVASGDEILPEAGLYRIPSDKVRLSYRVDSINLLDYVTGVSVSTGVSSIGIDHASAPAEYYTAEGCRVLRPAHGRLYIRVEGGKAEKVIL